MSIPSIIKHGFLENPTLLHLVRGFPLKPSEAGGNSKVSQAKLRQHVGHITFWARFQRSGTNPSLGGPKNSAMALGEQIPSDLNGSYEAKKQNMIQPIGRTIKPWRFRDLTPSIAINHRIHVCYIW